MHDMANIPANTSKPSSPFPLIGSKADAYFFIPIVTFLSQKQIEQIQLSGLRELPPRVRWKLHYAVQRLIRKRNISNQENTLKHYNKWIQDNL